MAEPQSAWTAFDYAVVDVEGNGQRPPDLVEISIVPIEGGIIGRPKTWLVRPPRPITPIARRFHKITDDQVADAPRTAEIADELNASLSGRVFVAHNAGVDLAVVTRELPEFQPEQVLDTLKLARRLLPDLTTYKLGALVDVLGLADGLPTGLAPHRATYDAIVCARLLVQLATSSDGEPLTMADLLNAMVGNASSYGAADEAAATLF